MARGEEGEARKPRPERAHPLNDELFQLSRAFGGYHQACIQNVAPAEDKEYEKRKLLRLIDHARVSIEAL